MRASKLLWLLPAAFALALAAQEYAQLTDWMKTSESASKALSKLEKKTGPEAVSNAERLGGVYEEMIAFWRQRNATDAVKWSEQGKAAAVQLASAANAGDGEGAAAALNVLSSTCRSCHTARRERLPDGKFRVK
jgi:mono/diheme cytochrome c family protein